MPKFVHELPEAKELFETLSGEKNNHPPEVIEKDYWVMHCLWGLNQQGHQFEMKGGTSLSKGWGAALIVSPKTLTFGSSPRED